MNSEPALTNPSSFTKPLPSASNTSRPPGTSSTSAANPICRTMPVSTSRQSTAFLWLENNQAMPTSTARPNRPKATRDRPSIHFPCGHCRARPRSVGQAGRGGQQSAGSGTSLWRSAVACDHPVAPLALGHLQAAVGAAQQGRQVVAVVRARGNAGTEGQPQGLEVAALGIERALAQHTPDRIDALPGGAQRLRHHQYEFLAPQAHQSLVALGHALEDFDHMADRPVAGMVAGLVIDTAEVVQVDQRQAEAAVLLAGYLQQPRHAMQQPGPVR